MTTLTAQDIERIAGLAKLGIHSHDNEFMQKELNRIIELVTQIEKIDTSAVQPLAHPHHTTQPLRDDIVTEADQRALLQQAAPQTVAGLYRAPVVIENKE